MSVVTPAATSRYVSIASPSNSEYSDHPKAASTPSEMSVSIVAVAWRRLRHAATWNGHAPHVTTGVASASASHSQPSNCSAGIIDISTTGTDNRPEISNAVAQRWLQSPWS